MLGHTQGVEMNDYKEGKRPYKENKLEICNIPLLYNCEVPFIQSTMNNNVCGSRFLFPDNFTSYLIPHIRESIFLSLAYFV